MSRCQKVFLITISVGVLIFSLGYAYFELKSISEVKLRTIYDITIDENDSIFLIGKDAIIKLDKNYNVEKAVPLDRKDTSSQRIALGNDGKLFALDRVEGQIRVFDSDLKLIKKINISDSDKIKLLRDIAIDKNDNLLIASADVNPSLHMFNSDGSWIKSITNLHIDYPFSLQGGPDNILVNKDGDIILSHYAHILNFDSFGNYTDSIRLNLNYDGLVNFESIIFDSTGRILATQADGVYVFDSNGNFNKKFGVIGQDAGQIITPHNIAIDSKNNIYVQQPDRITVFDSDGNFLKIAYESDICAESVAHIYKKCTEQ
jgi:DNA-binding beta-propeller fold protein YncE